MSLPSETKRHLLDVTEVLERILFMLNQDDLANARLVSRFWAQSAYRPYWQYPDLRQRGLSAIQERLARHGKDVLALDFTQSKLYSRNPLEVVDNITQLCPNVQELALQYGAFTFMGVTRLIFNYKTQLKVLRLDLSKTRQQPLNMDLLACLKHLERLELKIHLSNLHASFLNYDELFKACPRLWELIIGPAPYFDPDPAESGGAPPPLTFHQEILSHPLVQHLNQANHHHHTLLNGRSTTTASLEAFTNNDLSRLRRLWLSLVWFSADHIRVLARACPNLTDLRLSYRRSMDFNVSMPPVPFSLYLESWPNIKSLWIDGSNIALQKPPLQEQRQPPLPSTPSQQSQSQLSAIPNVSLVQSPVGDVPPVVHLTTLSLQRVSSLSDEALIQIVGTLGPLLSRLNVNECVRLTDTGIRHVLMHSSALVRLSAAELNLTMNLFEDDDCVLDSIWRDRYKEHFAGTKISPIKEPIRGHFYEDKLPSHPWACAMSLKTLDLSWRGTDGRPAHVQTMHAAKEFATLHGTDIQAHAFPVHPPISVQAGSSISPSPTVKGTARNAHGQPYTFEYCTIAEIVRWKEYDALKVLGWMGYEPLFRKKHRLASMYHRLRQLVNLEALLMRGWTIPWRACDLVAFTPPPMHELSPLTPTNDVYHALISLRYWQGGYRIQALDGFKLPQRDDRPSQHLAQEGFMPNLRYLDITLKSPKVSLDPHNEALPTTVMVKGGDKAPSDSNVKSKSSGANIGNNKSDMPDMMELSEYAQYSTWAAWIATCPRLETIMVMAQWLDGHLFPKYHEDVQLRLLKQEQRVDHLAPPLAEAANGDGDGSWNEAIIRTAVCTLSENTSLTSEEWADSKL